VDAIESKKSSKKLDALVCIWQLENNDVICPLVRPINLGPQSFVKNVIIVTLMFRRQMLLCNAIDRQVHDFEN
jgi:hypothetical protein